MSSIRNIYYHSIAEVHTNLRGWLTALYTAIQPKLQLTMSICYIMFFSKKDDRSNAINLPDCKFVPKVISTSISESESGTSCQ